MSLEPFVSSDTDEWATPPAFVRPLADAVGGFDLDAAAGAEESALAAEAYTEADDGLRRPWHGAVWCNPPYSTVAEWVDKTLREYRRDEVRSVVLLCKGDSSTKWWHRAADEAALLGMIQGRLSFGGPDANSAPFPSHVFVFGAVPDAVREVLAEQGVAVDGEALRKPTEQTRLSGEFGGGGR